MLGEEKVLLARCLTYSMIVLDWRSRSLGIGRWFGEPVLLVCHPFSLLLSSVGWSFYPFFWLRLFRLCLAQIVPWSRTTHYRNMITIAYLKYKWITSQYLFSFSHGRN
jgi:hypothetical protein